ncbi:MAG: hypothetical protein MJ134_07780 [Lachnospiraceae bacterium]|nr:hypothetical protein [Lachnospiraceae bacterium]
MIRGTTPTIELELLNLKIDDIKSAYVTIKQGDVEITKELDGGIQVDRENNILRVKLTQKETLRFCKKPVKVQLRAVLNNDTVVASDIFTREMEDVLLGGEIL